MHHHTLVALAFTGVLAMTGPPGASTLHAQAVSSRFHADTGLPGSPAANRLSVLSRDRAARWATAARVIHCAPAPLTERPGIESEFARPRVVPLESAFADAALVKRAMVSLRIKDAQ